MAICWLAVVSTPGLVCSHVCVGCQERCSLCEHKSFTCHEEPSHLLMQERVPLVHIFHTWVHVVVSVCVCGQIEHNASLYVLAGTRASFH